MPKFPSQDGFIKHVEEAIKKKSGGLSAHLPVKEDLPIDEEPGRDPAETVRMHRLRPGLDESKVGPNDFKIVSDRKFVQGMPMDLIAQPGLDSGNIATHSDIEPKTFEDLSRGGGLSEKEILLMKSLISKVLGQRALGIERTDDDFDDERFGPAF